MLTCGIPTKKSTIQYSCYARVIAICHPYSDTYAYFTMLLMLPARICYTYVTSHSIHNIYIVVLHHGDDGVNKTLCYSVTCVVPYHNSVIIFNT